MKYDVLAIGELNVDLIMNGLGGMPVPGTELIAEDSSLVMGSSTAITACWLAKLGLRVGFVGKVGKDAFAEVVFRGLREAGIDSSPVIVDESIPTGITVSLTTADDRAMVTHLGSIEALTIADIDLSLLDQTRHIHVGSFFLQHGLRPGLATLFEEAHRRGVTTSLDVGWDNSGNWDGGIAQALRHTDLFFPNHEEATRIAGVAGVPEALERLAKLVRRIVIKRGAEGAVTIDQASGEVIAHAGFPATPIDTTGAGDSFNAGYIYAFLQGCDPKLAMIYGNACGSINVAHIGGASAPVTLADVERVVQAAR